MHAESFEIAGLPAIIYAFQNMLMFTGTKYLDGLSLNIINQTKTLFGALFVFLLLRKPQSLTQCFALAMMFGTLVIMQL